MPTWAIRGRNVSKTSEGFQVVEARTSTARTGHQGQRCEHKPPGGYSCSAACTGHQGQGCQCSRKDMACQMLCPGVPPMAPWQRSQYHKRLHPLPLQTHLQKLRWRGSERELPAPSSTAQAGSAGMHQINQLNHTQYVVQTYRGRRQKQHPKYLCSPVICMVSGYTVPCVVTY